MNKTTEIKYEIFGEVLRKAKELAETAVAIKQENEEIISVMYAHDENTIKHFEQQLLSNENNVHDLLDSILQNLGTLQDLQEILIDNHKRDLFDLEFELNYKNKGGK